MLDSVFLILYNGVMKDLGYLRLIDLYGGLLTEHQKDVCELYYMCDLSLAEIAEQKGVSRQSVSDTLSKSRAILDDAEKNLRFEEILRAAVQRLSEKNADAARVLDDFLSKRPEYMEELSAVRAALLQTADESERSDH